MSALALHAHVPHRRVVDLARYEIAARAQAPRRHEQVSRFLAGRVTVADPASLTVGVAVDETAAQMRAMLDAADPSRELIASFAVHSAGLDEVFLALTGGN